MGEGARVRVGGGGMSVKGCVCVKGYRWAMMGQVGGCVMGEYVEQNH